MAAYYNEIDPYAAEWLRNLIVCDLIAYGDVDARSIEDVTPDDLRGYTQCHFFAGIGVWSYSLRQAGWPDDRPVWTGSCPCQPFSAAGKGKGFADERHLWPAFHHLISQRQPSIVIGEQVASKDAGPWIDLVQTDLEALGYSFGAVPFPSASVGAPHIRDRLYWVADAQRGDRGCEAAPAHLRQPQIDRSADWTGRRGGALGKLGDTLGERLALGGRLPGIPRGAGGAGQGQALERAGICAGGLADADGRNPRAEREQRGGEQRQQQEDGGAGGLADATGAGWRPERANGDTTHGVEAFSAGEKEPGRCSATDRPGPTNGYWRDADWLFCRDGKWRPVEPGTFPLAHGAPARVGRLRAYGNAINAVQAQVFIEAVMGCQP